MHIRQYTTSQHTIFIKEHTIRKEDPDKPAKRTLFVLNVPPYITEEHLKYGFQKVGEVTNVLFQEKVGPNEEDGADKFDKFIPRPILKGFKVAYVIFKSTKSIAKALQLEKLCIYDEETGQAIIRTGVTQWMQDYVASLTSEDDLQREIDEYMADYDKAENAARVAEKTANTDDDGWVTVTRRGPVAGFEQKESTINKVEEKMEKKRKQKELTNFYTFQIRQSKMQHIVNLRKKFEEDKRKIERLKTTRRFDPFKK